MHPNNICPVCRAPYSGNTTTCSTTCRAKASRRKRAHQPIANPYSPQEVQTLLTELADLKTENQRLRAAQKRTKDWKTEATKAQAKLATAEKRLNPALEHNKSLTQKNQQLTRQLKKSSAAIYRLTQALGAPRTLIADYMHFARWYYHHKPKHEWDEHDYSRYQRLTTYQSHKKNQPTRGTRDEQKQPRDKHQHKNTPKA